MMFIPATPDSELRRMIEEEIATTSLKIKVVERAGIRVKKLMQKNDPIKENLCNDVGCMVCSTTGEGNCRKNGITYCIVCKGDCRGSTYHGETHMNGFTWGSQHMCNLQYKKRRVCDVETLR